LTDDSDSSLGRLSLPFLIVTTPASPQLDRSTICTLSAIRKIKTFLRVQNIERVDFVTLLRNAPTGKTGSAFNPLPIPSRGLKGQESACLDILDGPELPAFVDETGDCPLLIGPSVVSPTLDVAATNIEIEGGARLMVEKNVVLSRYERHDCVRSSIR